MECSDYNNLFTENQNKEKIFKQGNLSFETRVIQELKKKLQLNLNFKEKKTIMANGQTKKNNSQRFSNLSTFNFEGKIDGLNTRCISGKIDTVLMQLTQFEKTGSIGKFSLWLRNLIIKFYFRI